MVALPWVLRKGIAVLNTLEVGAGAGASGCPARSEA